MGNMVLFLNSTANEGLSLPAMFAYRTVMDESAGFSEMPRCRGAEMHQSIEVSRSGSTYVLLLHFCPSLVKGTAIDLESKIILELCCYDYFSLWSPELSSFLSNPHLTWILESRVFRLRNSTGLAATTQHPILPQDHSHFVSYLEVQHYSSILVPYTWSDYYFLYSAIQFRRQLAGRHVKARQSDGLP